ncbi:MAG: hypothetical protein ACOX9R_00055 [Armatimonadota bacterium]|jgi:hypothetical protein
MKQIHRAMYVKLTVLVGAVAAEAQYGAIDPSATLSGLFLDGDTQQVHNTTLDLIAELENPTGTWELIEDEEYEFEVTIEDTEGSRVSSITLRDPTGQLVDQATADPPASTLGASGEFEVQLAMRLDFEFTTEIRIDAEGNVTFVFGVKAKEAEDPPPLEPTKLVVAVRDFTLGGAGTPAIGSIVEIWPAADPTSKLMTGVSFQGEATFQGIAPGEWIVRVIGVGPSGACEYEFNSVAVIRETTVKDAPVWQHQPITGRVWFKNELEEVVPGHPGAVTMTLLQNGQPVGAVTPSVGTSQNPNDGSYTYVVPSESLIAGDYVLRASFDQTTLNEDVSYPNHCNTYLPQVVYTHRAPGAHRPVEGPGFVFTIEDP